MFLFTFALVFTPAEIKTNSSKRLSLEHGKVGWGFCRFFKRTDLCKLNLSEKKQGDYRISLIRTHAFIVILNMI